MVGQFADEAIGQTVFVDPGGIAEDAVEAQVGLLDAAKGCLQGLAYVFADGKDIVPAAMRGGGLGARASRPLCGSCRRPALNALICRWLVGSAERLLVDETLV